MNQCRVWRCSAGFVEYSATVAVALWLRGHNMAEGLSLLTQLWHSEPMNEPVPVGSESLVEVRRWLRAVEAITEAVNSTQSLSTTLDLVASSARATLDLYGEGTAAAQDDGVA